ncbi:hypothetical protein BDR07DRAFT_1482978 [Suillus spraguei]|nr:hypothetical protein BDR07DRAFT_1482978 [Suillus spraguei]
MATRKLEGAVVQTRIRVILNTIRKHCTKAKKAADDKLLTEELQAKEAAVLQGIQHLADIQAGMEQAQTAEAMQKPKAVTPRPVPAKKMPQLNNVAAAVQGTDQGHQVQGKGEQGQLTFNVDEDNMSVDKLKNPQVAKLRPSKKSLKDAVDAQSKSMKADQLACVQVDCEDRKGNLLQMYVVAMLLISESTLFFLTLTAEFRSAVKPSFGGRVKAWASDIPRPSSHLTSEGSELISCLQASAPPPSTIFFHSQATATLNATSVRSHAIPQKDPDVFAATIDDLVGGFGEDDTDDSYECQAASQVGNCTGKPAVANTSSKIHRAMLIRSSAPPLLRSSAPPLLRSSAPPLLRSSAPPLLRSSAPPLLRSSAPPLLRSSAPPLLRSSAPPLLRSSAPPLLRAPDLQTPSPPDPSYPIL